MLFITTFLKRNSLISFLSFYLFCIVVKFRFLVTKGRFYILSLQNARMEFAIILPFKQISYGFLIY